MRHKYLLTTILLLSLISIGLLYFGNYRFLNFLNLNSTNLNKLIENLSFAYIASYVFYFIVVYLKEKDEKKVIYPFIADYTYVLMNNAILFASTFRDFGGLERIKLITSIHGRDLNIYPTTEELKILCKDLNPMENK